MEKCRSKCDNFDYFLVLVNGKLCLPHKNHIGISVLSLTNTKS